MYFITQESIWWSWLNFQFCTNISGITVDWFLCFNSSSFSLIKPLKQGGFMFYIVERYISIYTSCQKWRLKNSISSVIHWYHDVKWILFNPFRMKNHPIEFSISGILDCQHCEIGKSKWLYLLWLFFTYNISSSSYNIIFCD